VVCVGIASFLYNIPRFFEVTWSVIYDEAAKENKTEVSPTLLREDQIYIRYIIICMNKKPESKSL
jgi:hypothetical protein